MRVTAGEMTASPTDFNLTIYRARLSISNDLMSLFACLAIVTGLFEDPKIHGFLSFLIGLAKTSEFELTAVQMTALFSPKSGRGRHFCPEVTHVLLSSIWASFKCLLQLLWTNDGFVVF